MAIGRVNTGGGGGSGGTLTVTGVAGHTVTATKDGKTYTRTINSSGVAVFKGLATGDWTLTMTDGEQTATRTVTVTADYAVTIAYFTATISVTYPDGSTCTCTDGTTTLTAPDTSGSYTFTVPNTGTWTVTATDGDKTKSVDVEITTDGQSESKTLSFTLVLFDTGSYAAETGGWSGISGNYLTASVSGVATGETGYSAFYTKNKVDLTGYSSLHFTIAAKSGDEDYSCPVGASNYTSASGSDYTNFAASASIKNSAVGTTVAVDISALTTSYYVRGVAFSIGGGSSCKLQVSKIWVD